MGGDCLRQKQWPNAEQQSKNLIIIKYFIVRLTIQLFHLTGLG